MDKNAKLAYKIKTYLHTGKEEKWDEIHTILKDNPELLTRMELDPHQKYITNPLLLMIHPSFTTDFPNINPQIIIEKLKILLDLGADILLYSTDKNRDFLWEKGESLSRGDGVLFFSAFSVDVSIKKYINTSQYDPYNTDILDFIIEYMVNILDDMSHPTILGDLKRINKEFRIYRTFGFGEYRESEKLSNGLHSYIISKFIELFKIKNQKLIRAKQHLAYSNLLNERLAAEHDPQDKNIFERISQHLEKKNYDPTIFTRVKEEEKQGTYYPLIQSQDEELDRSVSEDLQNEYISNFVKELKTIIGSEYKGYGGMDGEVFGSNEMFRNLPGVNNDREDEYSDMPGDTSDDDLQDDYDLPDDDFLEQITDTDLPDVDPSLLPQAPEQSLQRVPSEYESDTVQPDVAAFARNRALARARARSDLQRRDTEPFIDSEQEDDDGDEEDEEDEEDDESRINQIDVDNFYESLPDFKQDPDHDIGNYYYYISSHGSLEELTPIQYDLSDFWYLIDGRHLPQKTEKITIEIKTNSVCMDYVLTRQFTDPDKTSIEIPTYNKELFKNYLKFVIEVSKPDPNKEKSYYISEIYVFDNKKNEYVLFTNVRTDKDIDYRRNLIPNIGYSLSGASDFNMGIIEVLKTGDNIFTPTQEYLTRTSSDDVVGAILDTPKYEIDWDYKETHSPEMARRDNFMLYSNSDSLIDKILDLIPSNTEHREYNITIFNSACLYSEEYSKFIVNYNKWADIYFDDIFKTANKQKKETISKKMSKKTKIRNLNKKIEDLKETLKSNQLKIHEIRKKLDEFEEAGTVESGLDLIDLLDNEDYMENSEKWNELKAKQNEIIRKSEEYKKELKELETGVEYLDDKTSKIGKKQKAMIAYKRLGSPTIFSPVGKEIFGNRTTRSLSGLKKLQNIKKDAGIFGGKNKKLSLKKRKKRAMKLKKKKQIGGTRFSDIVTLESLKENLKKDKDYLKKSRFRVQPLQFMDDGKSSLYEEDNEYDDDIHSYIIDLVDLNNMGDYGTIDEFGIGKKTIAIRRPTATYLNRQEDLYDDDYPEDTELPSILMGFRDDGHSIQTYLRIPLDLNELQNILHYQCAAGIDKKDVCENIDGCSYNKYKKGERGWEPISREWISIEREPKTEQGDECEIDRHCFADNITNDGSKCKDGICMTQNEFNDQYEPDGYWDEDYGGDCISDEVGMPHVEYLIIKVTDKPDLLSDNYIQKRLVQKRKEALTKHRLESKYPRNRTHGPSIIPYSTQKSHTVPWTAPGDDVLPIEIINKITSYMD